MLGGIASIYHERSCGYCSTTLIIFEGGEAENAERLVRVGGEVLAGRRVVLTRPGLGRRRGQENGTFRSAARTCGVSPLRTRQASSPSVTSRTQRSAPG